MTRLLFRAESRHSPIIDVRHRSEAGWTPIGAATVRERLISERGCRIRSLTVARKVCGIGLESLLHGNLAVERASGPQRRLSSRRLEFLHFGTDCLTVPPRIDQAEAHALYQGMASAVPWEAVNSGL